MRIPMKSHKKYHMFCPIEDDNSWLFKTKEEEQWSNHHFVDIFLWFLGKMEVCVLHVRFT
jgi:phage pi2 protein 07